MITPESISRTVRYVSLHPGVKHSTVVCALADDREGQARIRAALFVATARRFIVKSPKRPFTYTPLLPHQAVQQ
jgi:hypothetical protein